MRKTELPPWAEKRKYKRRNRMPADGRVLLEKNLRPAKHLHPYAGWDRERLIREAQSTADSRIGLALADSSLYLHLFLKNGLDDAYPEEAGKGRAGK